MASSGGSEGSALAVEREWQLHTDAHPDDGMMIRGLACFLADRDGRTRALELLHDFIRVHGGDARLGLDVGRIENEGMRKILGERMLARLSRRGRTAPHA